MPSSSTEPYVLVYTNSFKQQLKLVEAKYHSLIREALEKQLQYEPEVKTRNRKPLKKPMAFKAEWELRFRPEQSFSRTLFAQRPGGHSPGLRGKGRESLVCRRARGGTVKKAPFEKVQARLGQYVALSAKDPVLILRNGEPVAMLVGLARKKHRTPLKLRTVLKRAWKDYEEHGAIPHEQFWKILAKEVGRS